MLSRVTARVLLDSAKNRVFFGSALFSGNPSQQNYESSPTIPPALQSHNKNWAEHLQQLREEQIKLTNEVIDLKSQMDARFTQLSDLVMKLSERDVSKESNIGLQLVQPPALPLQPHEEDIAGFIRKILLQFPREHFEDLDGVIRSDSSQDLFSDDNHVEANCGVSPTLLKLMRDVVSELVVFHKWGIAHGSLNPRNILLIKKERLFAKLSDPGFGCDVLDWETPEQLLGGKQSAAGDMFNFGCVLFFCISRGGHPFGENSDERRQNIKQNKSELSQVNRFPEVSRLLSNLLNPDPKMRLSAIEVLNYPLFWSSKKRLEFIYETNVFISKHKSEKPDLPLWKEIENIMHIAMAEKSSEEVDSTNVPRGFDEFPSLLNYVYHLIDSYRRIHEVRGAYEPVNDSLKPLYRRFDDYFRQVPWLFIHLYEIVHKHCENERWFSKYCHKQHPKAVTRSG